MKLIIETLTPVHIYNGKKLSPYTDYIYENGKIYYIDVNRLNEKILSNDMLFENYINEIKKIKSNTRDKFTLKKLFNKYKLKTEEYSIAKFDVFGHPGHNEIHEIIKTNNKPYIPGSSIKGAIRTCLLFDYLQNINYDYEKIKKLSFIEKKGNQYIGQDVFRRQVNNIQSDIMKFIHVTDTKAISISNMKIYKEFLVDLYETKLKGDLVKGVPMLSEAINKGTKMVFEIRCKGRKFDVINSKFKYVFEGNEELLFDKINNFYEKNLNIYIKEMEMIDKDLFAKIISQYNSFLELIDKFKINKNGFIMRLGSHRNLYDNTIVSLFEEEEMEQIKKVVTGRRKNIPTYKPYPKTSWFILDEYGVKESIGWVKVEKEE